MSKTWRRQVHALLGLWLPPLALWANPAEAALPAEANDLTRRGRPEPLVFDNLSERQELQRYAGHSSHSSHSSHASHSSHYSSSGGGRYLPPAPLYSPPPPTPRTPSYPTLTPRLFDVPSTPGQGQGKPSADELTEMVRTVQLALIARGYDLSFPDGKFGPETRTALKQYQQDSGFNVTGRLDARTLGSLGILGR